MPTTDEPKEECVNPSHDLRARHKMIKPKQTQYLIVEPVQRSQFDAGQSSRAGSSEIKNTYYCLRHHHYHLLLHTVHHTVHIGRFEWVRRQRGRVILAGWFSGISITEV